VIAVLIARLVALALHSMKGLLMFRLPGSWVWDFWLADDGDRYHLFFLKASRALIDPDRRHWRATIGHAVSGDLRSWAELPDALVPDDGPAWDDMATWTGCVVHDDDGVWRMFYTGVSRAEDGLVQRVGVATSIDLMTWHRAGKEPLLESDGRTYERLADAQWQDEAWRDPWVFRDPGGVGWHMLLTARASHGAPDERGVVGQAWSANLDGWEVRPPLSRPGAGFGQLEVTQVEVVDGRPVLLFSCLRRDLSTVGRARHATGGVWAVAAPSLTGPFDISRARLMADERLYSGRLVRDRAGDWVLLAFRNVDDVGRFVGEITDPMPVRWSDDGQGLELVDALVRR